MGPMSVFTDVHLDWYKMTPEQAEEAGMGMPRGGASFISLFYAGDAALVLSGWQSRVQLVLKWQGEWWTADVSPLMRAFLESLGVDNSLRPTLAGHQALKDLNKRIIANSKQVPPVELITLNNKVILSGRFEDRPEPGEPGRYYQTENGLIYMDTGTAWIQMLVGIDPASNNPVAFTTTRAVRRV